MSGTVFNRISSRSRQKPPCGVWNETEEVRDAFVQHFHEAHDMVACESFSTHADMAQDAVRLQYLLLKYKNQALWVFFTTIHHH